MASLCANAHNLGTDPEEFLDAVPLQQRTLLHKRHPRRTGRRARADAVQFARWLRRRALN